MEYKCEFIYKCYFVPRKCCEDYKRCLYRDFKLHQEEQIRKDFETLDDRVLDQGKFDGNRGREK